MKIRKTLSCFRPYRASIFVVAGVSAGFWMSYMDGTGPDAVLRSAVIVASVMIVFFAAGTLWQAWQPDQPDDNKDR